MSNFDNLHSLNFDEFYVKSMIIFKTPMYGCKLMTMEEWVINTSIMNVVDVLITAWSYLRGFRPRVGNTCTLYADIKNCSLIVWIRFNRCLCFPKFIINSSLNEITFIHFFLCPQTCMLIRIVWEKVRLQNSVQNLIYELISLVPLSRLILFFLNNEMCFLLFT